MERLTREQAAIIGAYTGTLSGPFSAMHKYIEKVMGRPVASHETDTDAVNDDSRVKPKPDFPATVRHRRAAPRHKDDHAPGTPRDVSPCGPAPGRRVSGTPAGLDRHLPR